MLQIDIYLNKWKLIPVILFASLCALIYWPVVHGQFLGWDDTQHILLNRALLNGDYSFFWTSPYYGFFIPVIYSAWTLIYHLWPDPMAFHIFNLLLHYINALLLYYLCRKLFANRSTSFALIISLFFLCHPLQVESVAWIAGGRDLLAATFLLLSLHFALKKTTKGQVFGTFLFLFGLLAKPSFLLIPMALFLFQKLNSEKKHFNLITLGLWMVLCLVSIILTKILQGEISYNLYQPGVFERILVSIDAYGFYLYKFVLPIDLSADYGRTPQWVLDNTPYYLTGLISFAFFVFMGFLYKQQGGKILGPFIIYSFLLAPVLGLITFAAQSQSTVFDRYLYLPLIFLSMLLCQGLWGRKFLVVSILFICGWSVASFNRTRVWIDNTSLSKDMVEKNPKSYDGLNNLAVEYILSKEYKKAMPLLKRATQLRPQKAIAWANLGQVYWLSHQQERILREITILLIDKKFLASNRNEEQALALMNWMSARYFASRNKMSDAKTLYCKAKSLNSHNKSLQKEVESFLSQTQLSCL